MDTQQRGTLTQRLVEAEAGYLDAVSGLDGSPEAETLLAWARDGYRAAEMEAIAVLGARAALELVEQLHPGARPRDEVEAVAA
ncbi:hypothetical protein [Myxococcus eversor]|uniref:hypothetical protein n=1 Tax=Myxococcus eversor TaxID=2709661 RepID=UPI0013D2FBB7|nr:hypothetical protein [Myxococcus eversor]